MAKKFIVTDLDGTLLDDNEFLSEDFSSRLNTLIKKGLDFSVATTRDFENTETALKKLNFSNPVILASGAILSKFPTEVVYKYLTIKHNISLDILDISNKMNLDVIVLSTYNSESKKTRFIKGHWWNKEKLVYIERKQYEPFLNEPIINIQYCYGKSQLEPLYEEIRKKYGDNKEIYIHFFEDSVLRGKYWLIFNNINAKKEVMLEHLLKIKGYKAEDLIVFGDNFNDIGMFDLAGISCAVKNAPKKVKEYADHIVPSNINGGVIQYLEENLDLII
ncbi:MAG: HAD-IIB family hydrolase [Promethearchaeota archaeon]